MPRRVLLAIASAALVLTGSPAAAATDVPVRVTGGPDEVRPVVGAGGMAWMQASRRNNDSYDVFAQVGSGEPVRVHPRRSEGQTGGIDGSRLIFEVRPRRGDTNLRLLDLSTGRRLPLPKGVNTRHHEFAPSISGNYVLFGRARLRPTYERILLLNLSTGTIEGLATHTKRHVFFGVGQVNGDYLVWYECRRKSCTVYRRQISGDFGNGTVSPEGTFYYTPGVAPDGTVYFFRSGRGCGSNVALVRWSGFAGDPVTVVHQLPDGIDAQGAFVWQASDREIHYGRVRCGGREPSDLYKVVV